MIVERLVALFGIKTDDASFSKAEKGIQRLRSLFKAATVAAGAMAVAFGAATNAFAKEADATAKHARKINIAVEALQELQFAGERSGISINTTNAALQRLQRRTSSAARGMGPAVDAFAELGLNAAELNRLKTDQILERVLGALQQKPKQDWNRILTAIADIEGTEFSKLAEGGLGALRELRRESQKLGGVFSEDEAKQAEAYQDAMFNIRWALSGIRNMLVVEVLPKITSALSKTTQFIAENRDGIAFVAKAVGFVVGALSVLMFGKQALIGGILLAVILAIEDIYSYFQGKDSVTGVIVEKFKEAFSVIEDGWNNFIDNFTKAWEKAINTIADFIPDWMKDWWNKSIEADATLTQRTQQEAEASPLAETARRAQVPQRQGMFSQATYGAQFYRRSNAPSNDVNVTVPVSINGVPAGEIKKSIKTDIALDNGNSTQILSSGDQY